MFQPISVAPPQGPQGSGNRCFQQLFYDLHVYLKCLCRLLDTVFTPTPLFTSALAGLPLSKLIHSANKAAPAAQQGSLFTSLPSYLDTR